MKILIFTSGYFPGKKYGGPPVSIKNICNLLDEFQFYIVTKDHDLGEKIRYSDITDGWNKSDNCMVLYLNDNKFNKKSFGEIINEIKPDIIYLQSLFQRCTISYLQLAKKYHIKLLLAPRGELCKGAFKKKYKKLPYLFFLKKTGLLNDIYYQSTSEEETMMIQKYLCTFINKIYRLDNIPSIPNNVYKKQLKIPKSAKFIFFSRIVPKKNLLYAINSLKKITGNIKFDIYGPKEDIKYWEECSKAISELPKNIKVSYKGIIDHQDIYNILKQYDAFILPTLSENYGHVIVEAMMAKCIVIISDQTPWTNVNDYNAGWALSLSDNEKFCDTLQYIVNLDSIEQEKIISNIEQYLLNNLNVDKLREIYITCFNEIVGEKDDY